MTGTAIMDGDLGLAEMGRRRAAIECKELVKHYGGGKDAIRAVDRVNIHVAEGTM
jgi:hypothetical protein